MSPISTMDVLSPVKCLQYEEEMVYAVLPGIARNEILTKEIVVTLQAFCTYNKLLV